MWQGEKNMESGSNSSAASLRAVARRLGISIMTLYRVLNDVPTVRPETARRVLEELNRCGCYAHRRTRKQQIVFDVADHFYLRGLGLRLMNKVSGENSCILTEHRKNPEHFFNAAAESDVAVFFSIPEDDLIRKVRGENPNLYTVTITTRSCADVTITADNTRGGELAARHLHGNGHRHIAIHLCEEQPTRMERYKSFFAELKALDPGSRIDTVRQPAGTGVAEAFRRYFDEVDVMPTALFFVAGGYAQAFWNEVAEPGPERYRELSIMSYDRPEDIFDDTRSLHPFDRIEFSAQDILDWVEYYVTTRPVLRTRSPIHTNIDVRLVKAGSVKNLNRA